MTERLETQRKPSGARPPNKRAYVRGYDTNPHEVWGETGPPLLNKGQAINGSLFPGEETITAEDAPNAAKLAGLGYVAVPTSNWTVGQYMTVGTYRFHWNGTIWVAGPHP
jgi:hypothetical protein